MKSTQTQQVRLAYLGALVAVFLWGGNFVIIKLAFDFVDPVFLTALRFGLVALLLPLTGWCSDVPWRIVGLYALSSCLGQYLLSTLAIALGLSAGIAAFLMQSQVFFSVGLAYWVMHEPLRATTVGGCVIGLVGLTFVLLTGSSNATLIGFAVCLVAAASWSVAGLLVRRHKVQNILQLQTSAAALAFLPALGCSFAFEARHFDAQRIVADPLLFVGLVLYSTLLSFALAQTLWGRAIKITGLAAVSPLSMLVPVLGLALAHFVLGERYNPLLLASVGLVLAGLALHLIPILRTPQMAAPSVGSPLMSKPTGATK